MEYQSTFCKIFYDEKTEVLSLSYIKRPLNEEFSKTNRELLKIFREVATNLLLVDTRNMGVISTENQNEIIDFLIPKMVKHLKGEKLYHAQVVSSDIFANLSAQKIRSKYHKEDQAFIEIEPVETMEKGIEWLIQK